jgi:putative flippase GtrA
MEQAGFAVTTAPGTPGRDNAGPQVEIVVPVRNEERDLAPGIRRLCAYLRLSFPFTARVTIADNGSSDRTWTIAAALRDEFSEVQAVRLPEPGRGRALRSIWSASDAEILAYMDVDLSTDLNALLPLVAPLLSGHSDVAIGSRLARGSRVIRGPRREVISRGYNLLLHATLGAGFSDAQCGFKAIRREHASVLLPLTEDSGWFFDTELLVLAERAGLRIHEVPVDWIDDLDSRVDLLATALADLRGIMRLGSRLARGRITVPELRHASRWVPGGPGDTNAPGRPAGSPGAVPAGEPGSISRALPRQLTRFVTIGVASTLAYVLLYVLLRTVLPSQAANAVTLLATAVANTAANRRITFGIRGRSNAARHQFRGLIAFGAGLALTSGALATLHAISASPGRLAEVAVLVAANLVATVLRFVLYRSWVFGIRQRRARRIQAAGQTGAVTEPGLAADGACAPDRSSASPLAHMRRPPPWHEQPGPRVRVGERDGAQAVLDDGRKQ